MGYLLGIDIGGTNIKLACLKNGSKGLDSASYGTIVTPRGAQCTELAEYLNVESARFLKSIGVEYCDVDSVGIAMPGSLDVNNGVCIHAHNLALYNAPITACFTAASGCKNVRLINDADAATVAEYSFGALRGSENSCLLTLGTGVGAGYIIGGKLFAGGKGRGTELGHMTMDLHSDARCTCGNIGCLETLCSATFIERRAAEVYCTLSAHEVMEKAKNGDAKAVAIVDEFVENLGYAISSLIAVLDPQTIAIGGGVSGAGEFLLKPLKKTVEEKCFFTSPGEIVLAELSGNAGCVGAAVFPVL